MDSQILMIKILFMKNKQKKIPNKIKIDLKDKEEDQEKLK